MEEQEVITIALTGRPPVKIQAASWPIIAKAADHLYDGQYDFQSFRHTRARLCVRRHADGRAIVYGTYTYGSDFPNERNGAARRGRLVAAGDDIPAAVLSVADEMDEARRNCGVLDHFREPAPFRGLAAECIADLPAEELA